MVMVSFADIYLRRNLLPLWYNDVVSSSFNADSKSDNLFVPKASLY